MISLPRERTVDGGFHKDYKISRFAFHIIHNFLVGVVKHDIFGTKEVSFMAARNNSDSTISGVDVCQLELTNDQTNAHLAIRIGVILRAVEMPAGRTVQSVSTGALPRD